MSQTTAQQIGADATANKRAPSGADAGTTDTSTYSGKGVTGTGEKSDSLAAFMRAIKFHVPRRANTDVDRMFAQPHPRARQTTLDAETISNIDEASCVPSAN